MKFFKKILTGVLAGAMMCSLVQTVPVGYGTAVVAEAAGAVNILDYESNTSASEYAIYDVAGMEKLADLVNEKGVTFKDKNISLENDLVYDKNTKNNHTSIGTYEHPFNGLFDGKGHTIFNINIKLAGSQHSYLHLGLFGYAQSTSEIYSVRISGMELNDLTSYEWGECLNIL